MNQPPTKLERFSARVKRIQQTIERFFNHPLVKALIKIAILNEAVTEFKEKLRKQLGIWGEQFSIKISKFQKVIFIGMTNVAVWAYYAGKAGASNLAEWIPIFWTSPHVLTKMFMFSLLAVIVIWFFKLLRWAAAIGAVLLLIYGLYLLVNYAWKWLFSIEDY